jgi:hypothetical protein
MKNAHERFGQLEFTRQMRDTTTQVRLWMDRFIGEEGNRGAVGRAHLVSVVGSDQDVGAVWAGVVENDVFTVSGSELDPMPVTFGEGAQCFRGTLRVDGRKRPVRHLVVVSQEMTGKPPEDAKTIRTILCDSNAASVLYRMAERMGLPVVPEWAGWFRQELERHKTIVPLTGVGSKPLVVTARKKAVLKWIGRAVKRGEIAFPEQNGPTVWGIPSNFMRPALEESGETLASEAEMVGEIAWRRPF